MPLPSILTRIPGLTTADRLAPRPTDWTRALAAMRSLQGGRAGTAPGEDVQYSFVVRPGPDLVRVVAYRHRRLEDGAFTPGRALRGTELWNGPGACPAEDRVALSRLGFLGRGSGRYFHAADAGRPLERPEDLLALAGHPRVFLDRPGSQPVSIAQAEAGLAVSPCEGGVEVLPAIDGVAVPVEAVAGILRTADAGSAFAWFDRAGAALRVVTVPDVGGYSVVVSHLAACGTRFPPEAEDALFEQLEALGTLFPVHLATELAPCELPPHAGQVLQLELCPTGLEARLRVRPLEGAALRTPGEGPQQLLGRADGRRVSTRRDLGEERTRAGALSASLRLEGAEPAGPHGWVFPSDAAALAFLDDLRARERPEVEVEWIGEPVRVARGRRVRDLRVQVDDRRDWFGLRGSLEVDGVRVELAALLAALRERRRIVRLEGGAWLELGAELSARLDRLARVATPSPDGVVAGPAAVDVLDDLASDGLRLEARGTFARLRARMRAASRREPRLPAGLRAKLRPYQLEGFRWLARLASWGAGAVLADDMGLGKTLQTLALLCHRARRGPVLVVAPTSVCSTWLTEARRFAPSLRVRLFRELDRDAPLPALGPGDVLVASYGLLVRHAERLGEGGFETVVLDEAQALKNAATRRARAVRGLQAGFTLALSGTPIENRLSELWSLFRIVFPGLLGSWDVFRGAYAEPIERFGDEPARLALAATIRPFLLRRTKAAVAPELPPRTEVAVPVVLSPGEQQRYEEARLAAAARLAESGARLPRAQRRMHVLAAITELRLLACHPRLRDHASTLPSAKLGRFLELVAGLREAGHRVLVFSQFTRHLALVREALDEVGAPYLYLDGRTPPRERDALVRRFQSGEGDLFLISLHAGGTGLNLTAVDDVVHLDPWWNPAVEDQATDRAHRIGQTRPVTVYRLLSRDTIEEEIVRLQQRKRALVDGVLAGMDAAGRLELEELEALVLAGPSPVGAGRAA